MCRVAAPEDNAVSTVLDFTKRKLGTPTSSMAIREEPWQTVAQLSTMQPVFSAISWPMLMAWQLVDAQPYIRVFRDLTSIFAVQSIASS